MAGYTPNYGAGAPGKATPTYRSYYDYMSSTFVDHFNGLPARLNGGEDPPRPLDKDRYYDDLDSSQSSRCAQLAVEFYNQQQGYSAIILERAKDSHKFFSEGTAYFHVNFKAAFGSSGGPCYTFFAEVNGAAGVPESATMVVQFHTKEEGRTRDNCLYCTGIRHPEKGGFVGHHRLPHHQEVDEEDGGSSDTDTTDDDDDDDDGVEKDSSDDDDDEEEEHSSEEDEEEENGSGDDDEEEQ